MQFDLLSRYISIGLFASYIARFIPYELLLLPLYWCCKVRVYYLSRNEDCIKLQKRIKVENWTKTSHDHKGHGYCLSANYLIHLSYSQSEFGSSYSAWMLCREDTFNDLMNEEEVVVQVPKLTKPKEVLYNILLKNAGNYSNTYYYRSRGKLLFEPSATQLNIIEKIEESYRRRSYAVAFISGPPNSGKSMVGVFLNHRLGGTYCNEFTPWVPGDSISIIKSACDVCEDSPLVISMDEIDEALVQIANNQIVPNPKTMISTATKRGWNTLFDNIERGVIRHTIVLLTSNLSIEEIKARCNGDGSFLRENRVTDYYQMSKL